MFEKPEQKNNQEKPKDRLDILLAKIAEQNNREWQNPGLILPDGRIKIDETDSGKVFDIEANLCGANNPGIIEHYQNEFGADTPEKIVRQWKANRAKLPAAKWEKVSTILLHRVLQPEFIVVRASAMDDYTNGIDNIIVDKETGDVICAFDEVRDEPGGERYNKKAKDFVKDAKQGGANIKYGLGFAKDQLSGTKKLVRKTLNNIPKFYLSVSRQELETLLFGITDDFASQPTEDELKIFEKLMDDLGRQEEILNKERLPRSVSANLEKFAKFRQKMAIKILSK